MATSNIALTYSAGNKYLKKRYVDNDFRDAQLYGESPLLKDIGMQKKSGLKPGQSIDYPIKVGRTNHVSADFNTAQTAAKSKTGDREVVVLPFNADFFDVARVSEKAIGASKESVASFVDLLDDEVSDVFNSVIGAISGALYRSKSYLIGQTATNAGVTVNTKEIELSSVVSFLELEVGMQLDTAYDDAEGTSLGKVTITKVDRLEKKIIVDNLPAGVRNAASKKINVYYDGGRNVAGFLGLDDWLPATDALAATSIGGLDRSKDLLRLGGVRYSASNNGDTPILTGLQKGVVKTMQFYRNMNTKGVDKKIDCIYVHPIVHQILTDELGDKVRYNKAEGGMGGDKRSFGFSDVGIYAGGKYIPVKSDPFCPLEDAWALNLSSWSLNWIATGPKSSGPVHMFAMPEGGFLKTAHDGQGVEARVSAYPLLGCFAPGLNCRIRLSAVTKIQSYI